jgi:hypothetical protein
MPGGPQPGGTAALADGLRGFRVDCRQLRDDPRRGDRRARRQAGQDDPAPYVDILQRLWIIEPVPAWLPTPNRIARLASPPRHQLADPALAARLLGVGVEGLLAGRGAGSGGPSTGTLLGALFDSLATLSIRVFAQAAEATVSHLRTMLRCIGAQSKDVRRVFSSEGLFLAFLGWIVGLPLGYVVYQVMVAAMAVGMKLTMPDKYALIYVGWSLVFAMVGTLIVIFFPLRRATNMKPGDAIRYE